MQSFSSLGRIRFSAVFLAIVGMDNTDALACVIYTIAA